ncbi:MAG: ATP-binding cassette domain-containing protein [Bifidobacterium sp.]|nr:ATP-binding cassette domain-containing protein [Bifidobacterium sp.]
MVDKRLFSLVPGTRRLVLAKIFWLWIGLLMDIALAFGLVVLVAPMFTARSIGEGLASVGLATPASGLVAALAFVGIAVVRFLAHHFATKYGTEAAERVKLGLRNELYKKMVSLGPSYKQHVRTSDVVQLTGEGVDQVQSFFESFLPQLGYAILAPLTLFAVIAPLNMPTAVTLLVCAPLIIIIVGAIAMTTAKTFRKYWGKYTDMGAVFLDDLQGLEILKAFDADADADAAKKMDKQAEDFRVMTMRVLQIQLRSLTAMDVVAYGGAAAGIGVAVWQFIHHGHSAFATTGALLHDFNGPSLTLAGVLFVILMSVDFFLPLRQLGSYFHVAMNGMTSSKRIFALMDIPGPEYGDEALPKGAKDVGIEMKGLGFAYPDADRKALDDVTLTLAPRSLTAVVGESGSGKSTLAALVAGELDGYEGTLAFDVAGKRYDVKDLDEDSLVNTVAIVGARSHLFTGTLRQNLHMARPDATDAELMEALSGAHIADFVEEQPLGLDLPIEQDAANLSGGQRQRIAVARALLRRAPVVIFDEATSSVDAASEQLIMQTVHELAEVATVILVTHRLADAVPADRIAVFEHGRCVEVGRHQELMAAEGQYATMFATQASVEDVHQRARNAGIRYADGAKHAQDAHGANAKGAADAKGVERSVEQSVNTSDGQRGEAPSGKEGGKPMSSMQVISRLLGQVGELRPLMVLACVFGVIGHVSATFLPVFGVMALFAAWGQPVWGLSVGWAIGLMILCAVLRGVMRYCEQYMNHNLAFRLLALFRAKMFAALRRLALAKLAGKGKGDLISMVTTDVELLEIFFAHTISPTVIAISTTVIYAVALLFLNPWFALLLVVAHLVIGLGVPVWFAKALNGVGGRIRKESAALDDDMLDDMRGLEQIIRFQQGPQRLANIDKRSRALWRQRVRLSERNGMFGGLDHVIVILVSALGAGLALLVAGPTFASRADAVTALVLLVSSFGPTLALSALPASLTQTFASARRLFSLMDEAPAVVETGTEKPSYDGMRMADVDFSYDGEREILSDVSLNVPVSGILGLQGPSGRGKSTMLKLLMRYWDPQGGSVGMSEVELPEIDAHHHRRVQAMMSQETVLFDGSIASNLRIAKPEASDDELREALRKASVLGLVDSLPEGMETAVGELGGRLSEGERQRIGLARLFLRDADVYLFDEPTSRLDSLNEAFILQSINGLVEEKDAAVVLVSHRQSTMRIADEVVAM